MKDRKLTNVASSVRQRLLNLAHERGDDFNLLLTRFVLERLLYRLAQSAYRDEFIVKGATLFTLWSATPHRATRDIDLLGFGPPDEKKLEAVFRAIATTAVASADGVTFDQTSVRAHAIRENAIYDGIRVELAAHVGSARVRVQIDVGFGDSIVPPPEVSKFPVLLDLPAPTIRAYAPETVVAEKLHALVQLGMLNTRLKDYFDLWYLATNHEFEAERLASAIDSTFRRRGSAIPEGIPDGLDDGFGNDAVKQQQWKGFLKRSASKLVAPALPEAIAEIRRLVLPILKQLRQQTRSLVRWRSDRGWTEHD